MLNNSSILCDIKLLNVLLEMIFMFIVTAIAAVAQLALISVFIGKFGILNCNFTCIGVLNYRNGLSVLLTKY